jgi:hypothetical protein
VIQKTKMAELLQSFSRSELREFEKFLQSPFFTASLKVSPNVLIKFFGILKKYYPDFAVAKENVYSLLYQDRKYNDGAMRVLISTMLRLAEEYVTYLNFKSDGFEKRKNLLLALIKRKNDRLYEQHEKSMLGFTDAEPLGPYYYYKKFILSTISHKYRSSRQRTLKKDNFQEIENNFFYFVLSKTLDTYTLLTNEKHVFKKEFRLNFYDEIMSHIKKNNYPDNPLINLLINKLMITVTEDEIYYRKLTELKDRYKDRMEPQLIYDIIIDLTNYCIKRIKKGHTEFRTDHFKLEKEFLTEKIYGVNEYIHEVSFLNIIGVAANLKEFEWAENFIREYEDKLNPEHKTDTANFGRAVIKFHKKEYSAALEYLSKIKIEISHLKLSVRNFQLRIYYQLGHYEPAFSLIDSYHHFIAKDKSLPEYISRANNNFLKYYTELIRVKTGSGTSDAGELKRKLLASEYCTNKEWLLEKTEDLSHLKERVF